MGDVEQGAGEQEGHCEHDDNKADLANAFVVEGLSKRYGHRCAVKNVSLALPAGATLVIFGANGAGKTTLLRMLATIERPTCGTIRVLGLDLRDNGDDIRASLGFISHEPMLYPDLSAAENLMLFAQLYGVQNPASKVAHMLEMVKLTYRANDPVRSFSRGMTQRMSIARALIHDPAVVLLDEPYSGLDASAASIAQSLFLFEGAGAGECAASPDLQSRTVVMTSHDLAQGYQAATHLLLLSHGRLVLFARKQDVPYDEFERAYREQLAKGVGRAA